MCNFSFNFSFVQLRLFVCMMRVPMYYEESSNMVVLFLIAASMTIPQDLVPVLILLLGGTWFFFFKCIRFFFNRLLVWGNNVLTKQLWWELLFNGRYKSYLIFHSLIWWKPIKGNGGVGMEIILKWKSFHNPNFYFSFLSNQTKTKHP